MGQLDREREVFERARALSGTQRTEYLAGLPDMELRARIEALLTASETSAVFMANPTDGGQFVTLRSGPHEAPGTVIGRYKLLERLGEGGFGVVFMAEQREPVARKVALKVIKLGMDTDRVIARFEAERQALAMMDHPNIAKVLDAGATDSGRPYFVMELVKGEPIAAFCDRNQLTIEARLELFAEVCAAVQHAHQKGIIHRDIKPSNILVANQDGRPSAKIIDFGIAKAMAGRLTEKTLFTEHRALIGTPEYMSPEQAEGSLDIDTRTDVYSLGVLLYELLTGTTPFSAQELRSAAFAEIQRIIREVEPPKPSTRLSQSVQTIAQIAARRHLEPRRLGAMLRGDLDWIVMMALDKDRQRRYDTANALGADIRRFLVGEPVIAAPASRTYRARKFLRRHRGPVLSGAAVAAALIAGAAAFAWKAHEAGLQRDAAIASGEAHAAEQRKLEAMNGFIHRVLRSSDPSWGGSQGITVTEAMLQAVVQLDEGDFRDQPVTEAELRLTISSILNENGKSADALPVVERALAIFRSIHPKNESDIARAQTNAASVLIRLNRLAEAEQLARQALATFRGLFAADHEHTAASLSALGSNLMDRGRLSEAESYFTQGLEMRRRLFRADHEDLHESINNMAAMKQQMGDVAGAEPLFVEALDMSRRLHKGDHPVVANSLNNLAFNRAGLGRIREAEAGYREALEMYQRMFAGDHPRIASTLSNLGFTYRRLGQFDEAARCIEQSVDMMRRLHPTDDPDLARILLALAAVRRDAGRPSESLEASRQALAIFRKVHARDHQSTASSLFGVAQSYQVLGRFEEAEVHFQECLAMQRRLFPQDHPTIADALGSLALVNLDLGRPLIAEEFAREGLAMRRRLYKPGHPDVAFDAATLGSAYLALDRPADAEPLFSEALELRRSVSTRDSVVIASALGGLARARHGLGRHDEAKRLMDESVQMVKRLAPEGSPAVARALWRSAGLRTDPEQARVELESAISIATRVLPPDHPHLRDYRVALEQLAPPPK